MPSYISHVIFGEDVYKRLIKENSSYSKISIDDLKMYSLGADLSHYSKCSENSHNKDTKKYFIEMLKYIKQNNLQTNTNVISYLYGHIGHYFLDKNVHPLVYYNSNNLKKYKLISAHTIIETYIDYYLAQKKINSYIFNIDYNYLFNGEYSLDASLLTDYIYKKVYGVSSVSKSYKKVIKRLKLLQKILNVDLIGNYVYKNVINFIKENELNQIDIINKNNNYWMMPITNQLVNDSLMNLYNKSLVETINAIKKIDNYLYKNYEINEIAYLFDNSSYDTGIDCDYKKTIKKVIN